MFSDEGPGFLTQTAQNTKRASEAESEPWKGKAPNAGAGRGQWKVNSEVDADEKVGFAVVSVKLRPAEKAEFQALCKELGVSPNWAMRSMVRQASGFLEVQGATLDELRTITRQISGVATNINQIAKAGNRTLSPDYVAFMEDRKELGKDLARLERMMQHILNVGRRRSDGLAMLKQAVDAA